MTIPVAVADAPEEEIVVDGEKPFPAPFYDAVTDELMTDPVVRPNGDSIDQSTVQDDGTTEYYPNRALQTLIQSEIDLSSDTWQGSVRRLDRALQSGWGRLVEKSAFEGNYRPLPESFYCPITCELMTDPVISKYGISYEHDAIVQWINVNGKSPMTRDPLTVAGLRDNNALYELIQIEKGRAELSIHPSIRRWKESGDPTSRRTIRDTQQQPSAPPATLDHPTAIPVVTAAGANVTVPPAGGIVPPNNNTYPTTEAGIQARRRRQQQNKWTMTVICFSLLVIFFAFPYAFGVMIFVCLITAPVWCCCFAMAQGRTNN